MSRSSPLPVYFSVKTNLSLFLSPSLTVQQLHLTFDVLYELNMNRVQGSFDIDLSPPREIVRIGGEETLVTWG